MFIEYVMHLIVTVTTAFKYLFEIKNQIKHFKDSYQGSIPDILR